jgi:hypothetical protein
MAAEQRQLSFLEQHRPDDPVPVWTTLDTQQRAEVITALARVIAKLATAGRTTPTAAATEKEHPDER